MKNTPQEGTKVLPKIKTEMNGKGLTVQDLGNMSRGDQFIFVGGPKRTGTTLLQNILDSHPDILGGQEFHNILDIIDLRNKLHERIRAGKSDLYNTYEDIDIQICTLIENLLMPLLKKYGGRLLSEKTPQNIKVFPELMELFPGAHFIRTIRDPRAVILSSMVTRVKFKEKEIQKAYTSGTLSDFIGVTKSSRKEFLETISADKTAHGKVLTVIYEKLVIDTEEETKKICNFLGVQWSPDMLYPSRKKHLDEKSMTLEGVWYTKKSYNRDIDTSCINKWEKELTFFQKTIILYFFKNIKELADYGYDLSANSISQKILIMIFSCLAKINKHTIISRKFVRIILKFKTFTGYRDNTHIS